MCHLKRSVILGGYEDILSADKNCVAINITPGATGHVVDDGSIFKRREGEDRIISIGAGEYTVPVDEWGNLMIGSGLKLKDY